MVEMIDLKKIKDELENLYDEINMRYCKCEDGTEHCPNDNRCKNCKFLDEVFNKISIWNATDEGLE